MNAITGIVSLLLVVTTGLLAAGAPATAAEENRFELSRQTYQQVLKAREFIAADNYDGAVDAFRSALAIKNLPSTIQQELRYNLAQVYIALASAYAQAGEYARVIAPATEGISLSGKPQTSWYQLLIKSHYELRQFGKAAAILDQLVRLYPDTKSYWSQLASMQMEQKNEAEALAVLEIMYRKGMYETDSEYVRLADFLAYLNNPLRAGKVYQDALTAKVITPAASAYRKLAVFWQQAREPERAIMAYETALTFGEDADTQIDLLEVLAQQEDYSQIIALADSLTSKANEKQRGRVLLLKGHALYGQNKPAEALQVMRKAALMEDSSREATSWVNFLSSSLQASNLL